MERYRVGVSWRGETRMAFTRAARKALRANRQGKAATVSGIPLDDPWLTEGDLPLASPLGSAGGAAGSSTSAACCGYCSLSKREFVGPGCVCRTDDERSSCAHWCDPGHRVRVLVISPAGDLEGYADACQDFDGRFVLTTDEGDRFWVTGWACDVEIIEEGENTCLSTPLKATPTTAS